MSPVTLSLLKWCLKTTGMHPNVLLRQGWTEYEVLDCVAIGYAEYRAELEQAKIAEVKK